MKWALRRARTPLALLATWSCLRVVSSPRSSSTTWCASSWAPVVLEQRGSSRFRRPYLVALVTAANVGSVAT